MKNIIYIPADGETVPDPNAVAVDAVIAGQPIQVLSAVVADDFTTAGQVFYIGEMSGPVQVLPPGSTVPHQYAGWPVPTEVMSEDPTDNPL